MKKLEKKEVTKGEMSMGFPAKSTRYNLGFNDGLKVSRKYYLQRNRDDIKQNYIPKDGLSVNRIKKMVSKWNKDNMWQDVMGVNWYDTLDTKQRKELAIELSKELKGEKL